MARLVGGPFSEAQVEARLETEIARLSELGFQYWPMFLGQEGGAHAGCCGLKPYDLSSRILELGFYVRAEQWGKGLATEAARSAIRFAFEVAGARELFAGHHPENEDSRRVLEKLGFRYVRDELYPPTGLMHPGYVLTPSAGR